MVAHAVQFAWGAIIFALMPVMAAFYLGSEQNAGFFVGGLAALQVFLLNPIAGQIIDKKGSLVAFWIGLSGPVLGSVCLLLFPSALGVFLFFIGMTVRFSFFASNAYTLKKSGKDEGGFIFGLRALVESVSDRRNKK